MPPLLADTITPLIAADFVYLFIINAIIGVLEGKLIQRWFTGGRRAMWWMIAANYLSAWIGWLGLIWLVDPRVSAFLGPRPIERINLLAVVVVLISFAITVVVEAGFVHGASERAKRSLGRTLFATLCVNTISYVISCLLFLSSSFSLPFNARVRPLSSMRLLPRGTLYWVDSTGRIVARHLDTTDSGHEVGQVAQNDSVEPYQLRIEIARTPDASS